MHKNGDDDTKTTKAGIDDLPKSLHVPYSICVTFDDIRDDP